MSKNFRLNLPGLNELMKSSAMQAAINSAAAQIAANAGGTVTVEQAHPIGFVAIGSVRGKNKNGSIEKATGGVKV